MKCGKIIIQPPQHTSIVVAAARFHGSDDLPRIGEGEGLADARTSVDETGSLYLGVLVHVQVHIVGLAYKP